MSLYGDLCFIDILEPIRGKFKIEFTSDGDPLIWLKPVLGFDSPWISTMPEMDRDCTLWTTYFNHYGVISKTCRKCFKVGMEVNTLEDLFKVLDYQREYKDNCKCGIEKRAFTGRLGKYSAFWYCPIEEGLEGARKLYKRISGDFPTAKTILKRGCTEFEMRYNPSDKWDEIAKQLAWDAKEELLDQLFQTDPMMFKVEANTPKMLECHIIKKWIEWAFEHNDRTYLNYVDAPFKQELMNYKNSEGDYVDSRIGETESGGTCELGRSPNENCSESPGRKITLLS